MDPNELKRPKAAKTDGKRKYAYFKKKGTAAQDFLYLKAVDPHLLQDAIESVTADGNLISFTRTRDGGAITVTILVDGERMGRTASTATELTELLESLTHNE